MYFTNVSISTVSGDDPATSAWVSAVIANGGSVSDARKAIINTLIVGLKSDGLFTKNDRMWLTAAENQPSALTDIISTSLATAVNSPPFVADMGYSGDDANTATRYIDTNYNPSTNGIGFTQDSAHLSTWSVTNLSTTQGGCLLGVTQGGTSETNIFDTFTDGNVYARINDVNPGASGSQGAPGTRIGHWLANRSGASATQLYQNGSSFSSPNGTSAARANGNIYVLCVNDIGSGPRLGTPNQLAMVSIGGNLSSTDATNFYNRLRAYMTAVGVP